MNFADPQAARRAQEAQTAYKEHMTSATRSVSLGDFDDCTGKRKGPSPRDWLQGTTSLSTPTAGLRSQIAQHMSAPKA